MRMHKNNMLNIFFIMCANEELNEVPHRGRFRVSLLTNGSKARRGGTKLRLACDSASFGSMPRFADFISFLARISNLV